MTDLIVRPADEAPIKNREVRPDQPSKLDTITPRDDSLAEQLITTQSPQRPQSTPRIRLEVDGRLIEGYEGQTLLEVCRDNGIEIPTLCYEPKLPGFGACRMCVVEVEGEENPPISCSRVAEAGMKVQTQTDELRRLRKTNLELIFSDHNAYCLPPCQNKCPSHIDIPGFLKANAEANWRESARIFKRTIPFPSILGRVCPAPCEEHCRRDEVDEAIAIRDSHRYAGDQVLRALTDEGVEPPVPFEKQAPTGRRVAVIGSGPAGMAAAYYLLLAGHDVTVLERDAAPGGMLRYGIPQYRLPKVEVLEAEYRSVELLGGKIVCNQELGKDYSLDDLQHQGYDAVLLAMGCYDTNKLGIPNENADGVIDGLDYLRTATLGLKYPGHDQARVVVVGGGFSAMDCVRTSIRQGSPEVTLVYRRDMKDMPAASEVHEAIEEGVTTIFQAGPTRVITDANGKVEGIEFIRMQLGEPDASGRRRPEPAPGTEFTIPCDRIMLAIGQGPDLGWFGAGNDGVTATKQRRVKADAVTFATDRAGVFAAGDVRTGAATVVAAIAEGRRASYAVDAYLRGMDLGAIKTRQQLAEPQPEFLSIVPFTGEIKEPRYRLKALDLEEAKHSYIEYEIPYTRDEAIAESTRCLQCTCEAIRVLRPAPPGHRVRDHPADAREERPSGRGLPLDRREPVHRRQPRLRPRRQPRVHPPRARALHRLRPVRERLRRGGGRRLLRLHADGLRHSGDDAARHEPQRHAVRVLRPLRRDVPDGRAHAQAARAPEVRGRREPLHPVRHLRRRLPLRRRPRQRPVRAQPHVPRGAVDRPPRAGLGRARDGDELHPPRARLGRAGEGRGSNHRRRPAPARAAGIAVGTALRGTCDAA
ncbi:MAG: FAD-dependent oxidoreductase [Chloroflexota bacterium]